MEPKPSITKLALQRMREANFKIVQIVPAEIPGWHCAAYLAFKDRDIPINEVPDLPVPGCDIEHCICSYSIVR